MRHILPALEADEMIGNLRGLEVYVRESEERLRRQDRWFRSCNCFEEVKEREKIRRLGEKSSTWSVFEAD